MQPGRSRRSLRNVKSPWVKLALVGWNVLEKEGENEKFSPGDS